MTNWKIVVCPLKIANTHSTNWSRRSILATNTFRDVYVLFKFANFYLFICSSRIPFKTKWQEPLQSLAIWAHFFYFNSIEHQNWCDQLQFIYRWVFYIITRIFDIANYLYSCTLPIHFYIIQMQICVLTYTLNKCKSTMHNGGIFAALPMCVNMLSNLFSNHHLYSNHISNTISQD